LLGNNAQSFTGLNIVNDSNTCSIIHTTDPQFSITLKNKLFVLGQISNNVYAIDPITNTVIATIPVGSNPTYISSVGNKLYVNNYSDATVSVIDADTNTVIATIPVGLSTYFTTASGHKVYTNNSGSSDVSVIDTATDSVIATIPVGSGPAYSSAVNNKVYVSNGGSNSVSVIDTATDSVLNLCSPNLLSLTSTASNTTYTSISSPLNITANFDKSIGVGSKMHITLNTGRTVDLTTISGSTLSGTYTVQSGDYTPDLSVTSIATSSTYTFVSDTDGTPNSNSSYFVPSSPDLTGDTPRNLGDLKNIVIGTAPLTIPTGTNPYQMVSVGTYTYVANQGSNNVTIFNNTTNTVIATTTVGSQPYGMAYSTTTKEIYVANLKSNSVSVIDADPASGTWKQVTNTITSGMGVEPYYVASLGTKIYVTNNLSWTVSEINTATHAVTATINVGANPRGIKALGSKLYVANFGSNYGGSSQGTVSIIDTGNSNAVTTVNVGSGPRGVTVNGTDVYVANFNDNSVSRIDTANSNTVTTINVGTNPRGMFTLNNKIYVENYQDGTISIIDGTTHTVTGPYKVGNTPAGMTAIGNDVAISRFTDNVVDIFDTTNLVLKTVADVTTPIISLVASSTTQTTATITWTTDESATSTVNYGSTSSYDTASTSSTLVTSHSIALTGLIAGTTYHFQVGSADASGNVATSTDYTFTTSAVTNSGGGGSGGSSGGSSGGGSVGYATQPVAPNNVMSNSPSTAFSFASNLKQGDSGNNQILELQKFLNTHGLPVTKTGAGSLGYETTFFGPATKKALTLFQVTHGIKPAIGIFGPLTRKAINDILAKETSATTPTISPVASTTPLCTTSIYLTAPVKYGSKNNASDVKLLENFLNNYEGTNLPVTGIYSKADYDAVVKFQEKYSSSILTPWGLKKGTGYVFTTTLNQIKQVVEVSCKK
jgi:YVTN family beta-propeller protein